MTYVNWDKIQDVDHSLEYKTFNDLQDGDEIYEVDFKELKLIPLIIENYRKDKASYGIHDLNRFEAIFSIKDEKNSITRAYNGNQYFAKFHINYQDRFLTTDKRIGEEIINLLRARNSYQWNEFSNIFGHPLSGKYEPRHIVLR